MALFLVGVPLTPFQTWVFQGSGWEREKQDQMVGGLRADRNAASTALRVKFFQSGRGGIAAAPQLSLSSPCPSSLEPRGAFYFLGNGTCPAKLQSNKPSWLVRASGQLLCHLSRGALIGHSQKEGNARRGEVMETDPFPCSGHRVFSPLRGPLGRGGS